MGSLKEIEKVEVSYFKKIELMVENLDKELESLLGSFGLGTPIKSKMKGDIDIVLQFVTDKQGDLKGYCLTEKDYKKSPNKMFENAVRYSCYEIDKFDIKKETSFSSNASFSTIDSETSGIRASEGQFLQRYSGKHRNIVQDTFVGGGGGGGGGSGGGWEGFTKFAKEYVKNPLRKDHIPPQKSVELTEKVDNKV